VPDDQRRPRGVLDTSVIIDFEEIDTSDLPIEVAITVITLAELAAGPAATTDTVERGRRQDRLQRTEAAFDPLPFDADAARAYGRVFAVAMDAGQRARGIRAVDLLIGAVALASGLPLYTRNGDDFRALEGLIHVVVV
jgi:predicted nucleic acid-binding protein